MIKVSIATLLLVIKITVYVFMLRIILLGSVSLEEEILAAVEQVLQKFSG